ncbi:MAG: ABC transporter ATP-binding protein [Chloroflexota bacterium]|nr:MAG: ABC transporter ATP-binding protein [Chloroflexota bacterium]HDD61145.1 ABC transporter ATP-binding protein [Chloroflexota bacterium]
MNSANNHPLLEVKDLGVTFTDEKGSLQALNQINFSVDREQFICVVGPSGSGKSTLIRVLAGLLAPTSGEVVLDGIPINEPRQGVGIVFQKANLMPWRSVLRNITLPLETNHVPQNEANERASELIELVGLTGFEDWLPHDLSGGMLQRVAIARSLIQDPDLLLLDEPFGALDALTREKMGAELLRIWRVRKKTVIMITHDISEAVFLADRVLAISPQPGNLRLDLEINLERPRQEDDRFSPEFVVYTQLLRDAIR